MEKLAALFQPRFTLRVHNVQIILIVLVFILTIVRISMTEAPITRATIMTIPIVRVPLLPPPSPPAPPPAPARLPELQGTRVLESATPSSPKYSANIVLNCRASNHSSSSLTNS